MINLEFGKYVYLMTDTDPIPTELINTVIHLLLSFIMLNISILVITMIFRGMINISLGCTFYRGQVKGPKKRTKKRMNIEKSTLRYFDYTLNVKGLSRSEKKLVKNLIQDIEQNYLFLRNEARSNASLKSISELQNVLIISKELIRSFCDNPKLLIVPEFESFQYKDLQELGKLCQTFNELYELQKKLQGRKSFTSELEKTKETITLRADEVTQNYIHYKQMKLNEQLQ